MQPIDDVRILAVEQYGAGPWATMQLADLGAEVIKIEDPATAGDVGRYVPPYQEGDSSLFFESFNRGKRSVSLDIRSQAGRRVFEDLVRGSDAVFANLRGDVPEQLGLTYETLRKANPGIVCCSLSGYGRTGPRHREGAYDYVIQGYAGWMSLTGEAAGPPAKSGLSLVDLTSGYVSAIAITAGVLKARRDGVGCDCDLSLLEIALSQLGYVGTWVASRGFVPGRLDESAHPSIVPFQMFVTSDGHVVVACPKQKFWERLCEALDQPQLATDPRYGDFAGRLRHREELVAELREHFARDTTAYWMSRLREHGVPVGPVNDVAAALADDQVRAREALVEIDHPELGLVRQLASPLRFGPEPTPLRRAPRLGEHTYHVLRDVCDYSEAQIRELAQANAFGPLLSRTIRGDRSHDIGEE